MSRPKILFSWEMGANFGHVSKICEVAVLLTEQFEIIIAARHPVAVRQLYPDLPITLLAASYHPSRANFPNEVAAQTYPPVTPSSDEPYP